MASIIPEQRIEKKEEKENIGKTSEKKDIIRNKDSPDFIREENRGNIGKEEILGFTKDIDKPLEQRHLGNQDYYRDCQKEENKLDFQGNIDNKEKENIRFEKERNNLNIGGGEILGERSDLGSQNIERFAENKDENLEFDKEIKGINLIDKPEGTSLKDDKNFQSARKEENPRKEDITKEKM